MPCFAALKVVQKSVLTTSKRTKYTFLWTYCTANYSDLFWLTLMCMKPHHSLWSSSVALWEEVLQVQVYLEGLFWDLYQRYSLRQLYNCPHRLGVYLVYSGWHYDTHKDTRVGRLEEQSGFHWIHLWEEIIHMKLNRIKSTFFDFKWQTNKIMTYLKQQFPCYAKRLDQHCQLGSGSYQESVGEV